MILELSEGSTVASEPEENLSGSSREKDPAEQLNGVMNATEDRATPVEPHQDTQNENPAFDSPLPVLTHEQKGKTARLELYKALLSSAKTESPLDLAPSPSPVKKDDVALDVLNVHSTSMRETEAVTASLDTSALWAGESENPTSNPDDVNAEGITATINDIAPDTTNDGSGATAATPQLIPNQQNGDKEQTNQKEEEPIVVKAEPEDIDFTALAAAENSGTIPEHQVGEVADQPSEDATRYPHQEHQHIQPADVSMEEDPLLAELFPTFPMGESPMQANQTQTEEEADPLLAGMLQEVRLIDFFGPSSEKTNLDCVLAGRIKRS